MSRTHKDSLKKLPFEVMKRTQSKVSQKKSIYCDGFVIGHGIQYDIRSF